jgi:glycerophosphoryl diester phosphodiesterase
VTGRPLNIAHRGASAYAPENTFAAFDLAIDLGADSLELDVHMTSDGELIVIHDDVLARTVRPEPDANTDLVCETDWSSISVLDAGSWFNDFLPAYSRPEFDGLRVPLLKDLFARYGNEIHYFLELKHPRWITEMEKKLLDLMNRFDLFKRRDGRACVYVEAFNQKSLQKIHDMDPRVSVVQLFGAYATSEAIRAYVSALPSYSVAIGPCARSVDGALAGAARRLHLDLYPWTVNDPDQMAVMLELGADGIVSDFPDVLDGVIDARRLDRVGAALPRPA